jgi:hypothetical protein
MPPLGATSTTRSVPHASSQVTTSLGYDHNLSKRTDHYDVFMHNKITGLNSGNTFAEGLKHSF